MPFPVTPRVIYRKNPLEEVICQLRFPDILRIESEVPSAFQEHIRNDYPLFREAHSDGMPGIPADIAKVIGAELPTPLRNKRYEFISSDELWKITLSRGSIALSTRQYQRWEEFKEHLLGPLEALIEQYKPAFYSRIGLRYRDVIRRSDLGLKECDWSDLFKPHISGELSFPHIRNSIVHAARETYIELQGNKENVHLRHGLVTNKNTAETYYVIDADFFTEAKSETKDAISKLDNFNKRAGHLFRWCITDKLHNAMEPSSL